MGKNGQKWVPPPPQNPPLIISVTGPPGGTAHGCSKPLDTFKLVEVANLQNGGGGGAPLFFSPPQNAQFGVWELLSKNERK